jgi:hypothetical protein
MILSRVKFLMLALILVLTASLAQAAPASAAGASPSAAIRAPAFGGLLDDLFAFLSDLAGLIGSLFGGGHSPGGSHSGGGHSGGWSQHPKPPGHVPPVDWDTDWDGHGHKDSRDLWKKWYC